MWFWILIIIIVITIIIINKLSKKRKMAKEKARLAYEEEQIKRFKEEKRKQEEKERIEREKERALQKERERIENEKKEKKENISAWFKELSETTSNQNEFIKSEGNLGKLLEMKHSENDYTIKMFWNAEYENYIKETNEFIYNALKDIFSCSNYELSTYIMFITNKLKQLKFIDEIKIYDSAISELDELLWDILGLDTPYFLEYKEYGNYKLLRPLEDFDEDVINKGLNQVESHLLSLKSITKPSSKELSEYAKIAEYLNTSDFTYASIAVWFYAWKKPFVPDLFERACKAFGFYSNFKGYECAEIMLAKIYNWNSLGGSSLVMEYKKDILDWIENVSSKLSAKGTKSGSSVFFAFLSGLAWMELYDLELIVLKKLVELKVQLWSEAQERLKFLSSGGTANIKLYQPEDDVFSFDNSSIEWKEKEYDVFFRKLKMKNIQLNYSLVINDWKKTYPLQKNQEYSEDKLYREFESMIEDFDKEVILNIENAKSLNLKNVDYKNAAVFRFTSERNRCITMLFHAEIFGSNLNITILTLFTPEKDIKTDDLYKYAIAIKNNVYTESFKEAILESLDEVLKVKSTVYDDFNEKSNSSTSESFISKFFD